MDEIECIVPFFVATDLGFVEHQAMDHVPVAADVVQVLALGGEHGHAAVAVPERCCYIGSCRD